jgi:predicted phage terminase large subunit-like protein
VIQALSLAERNSANSWVDNTYRSRLDNPATGAMIIVMQRLHELDVTGYLLEREPGIWTHVCIPLVAEQDETWNFPISGRVFVRKAGEVLMSERFPQAIVNELRSRPLIFAAQYQQRPVPLDGNMVKRKEIRYYGAIRPQGGKTSRLYATAPEFQAGDWYVDRNAAWTEPFIEQITTFPVGRHDDMVDMLTQASVWLLQRPRGGWRMTNAFDSRIVYYDNTY